MTEPAAWDALFVLHARSAPGLVGTLAARHGCRRVLILSTHLVFPHERAAFLAALPPDTTVEFTTFAAQLDDATMAAIDAATTAQLRASPPRLGTYADHFEHVARSRKNAAVLKNLAALHEWLSCWVDHGLGIRSDVWLVQGARPLTPRSLSARWCDTLLRQNLAMFLRRWRLPPTATVVRDGDDTYVFLSTTRRLRFRSDATLTTLPTRAALALPGRIFAATTIHDHPAAVARLRLPLRVFADGYLPTNYSRSYLDGYGPATFVSAEPFAALWFAACARPVAPAPSFLIALPLAPAVAPPALATIVVLLGHSGDWSALVNRTDNDALVAATLDVARRTPQFTFILRPHPTMEDPRHEGPGARARLAAHVTAAALPHVRLSTSDLADDLARGDLFVSEYSATLIDAWRTGELGLIANLTGRRSFMQDFADLGFASVSSADALHAALLAVAGAPAAFAARQSAAASRYNALLAP